MFDVAILGGGMAGGLLARQLRRQVPTARVLLVEKEREPARKVGESTVDVCGKYLTKRLGLSSYLYQHQLPKNGLRFFFDREDCGAPIEELSEIGSTGLIPFPSFQLDRARFDADVSRMNEEAGVDVRRGVRVSEVRVAEGQTGAPHRITLEEDGVPCGAVSARWIVDATGRASVLARQKGLRVEAPLRHGAVWGRFTGVHDIDDMGGEPFRARVWHAARMLSTNHFCYPGYWIWLIPLGRGVTSVGVVMEAPRLRDDMRRAEGFVAFLRAHRAIAELLEGAELLDVRSMGQLAYGAARVVDGAERWALTGEAAAFTDPLYSPGGDFIALANDWISDLVRRDLDGEDITARAALYDRAYASRYRATLRLYEGLYGVLGSFELFRAKWDLDLACYLNVWVEPYLADAHLDLGALQRELDAEPVTLGLLATFRETFRAAEAAIRREGRFFEKNLGHAVLDPARRFVGTDFGTESSRRRATPRVRDAAQLVLGELTETLGHERAAEPVPFSRLTNGRALL